MTEEIGNHYLFPSTIFISKQHYIIDTVLGSCVAVCLYDQKIKIGGLNHFMLPLWNGDVLASPKYGNIAIEKLIEKMILNGASKQNMIAKIFGGANQINSTINIGERNIQISKEHLATAGIKIVAESVGGAVGRKIKFNTRTGEVSMKFLSKKEQA